MINAMHCAQRHIAVKTLIAAVITGTLLAAPSLGENSVAAAKLETLPFLDSSTSAQPLTMVAACERMGVEWHWRHHRNNAGYERRVYPGPAPKHDEPSEEPNPLRPRFVTSGTHGAYVNLISRLTAAHDPDEAGRYGADVAIVARAPSKAEVAAAAEAGLAYDVQPVAMDAFVFIVHRDNPVASLTLDQIRSVYMHKTKQWDAVGGPSVAIKAYRRNPSSGSEELMQRLVMKDLEMPAAAEHRIFHGMAGPINAMEHNEAGLAYTVYFYEQLMAARRWPSDMEEAEPNAESDPKPRQRRRKVLAIDGVKPTFETIAKRKYPLTTPVYVVIRKDTPADHAATKFRDWLLSDAGQKVVSKSGYVPIRKLDESE